MRKKKVLVLASTFPRWEGDTTAPFVLELEKRLTGSFDIHILAPHSKGAKKLEERDSLTIHRFQYFWPSGLQKLCYEGGILPNIKRNKLLIFQGFTLILFELIAAIKLIMKERIDLIHAHWIIPQGIIAYLLKIVLNKPYIITTHGGDIYGLQNPILTILKKTILKNANAITVVSTAIKDEIHKKIDSKLRIDVVSMGVDSQLFNPDKKDTSFYKQHDINGPLLLFVGRLVEKKGVEYLLRAMPQIISKFPNVKLLIIGEGTLKDELEKIAEEKKIKQSVIFFGPVKNNDLPKYYASSTIFVGPSIMTRDGDTEGLGLTFVEASLSECIPIGSNIGGIPDVIDNNKTGFLIKQKSSEDIADKVITILNDKKLATRLGKNARDTTKSKFDWQIVVNRYNSLYQTI